MRILVTGASGFVGRALATRLSDDGIHDVRATYRTLPAQAPTQVETCRVGDLGPDTDWTTAVEGADAVVHCAARVHVMQDTDHDPLAAYRRSNVDGTLHLAKAALAAGCRHFVFLSSIKVNGEATRPDEPFNAEMEAAPTDPYGISKLEAERGLLDLTEHTGMAVTIIRPVLVYGPGVRANFLSMMKWLARGIPLPLGAIHNRRSLVALDNLVDLIVTCLERPAAYNKTFLVSDGEDLSTTELLRRIAHALGRPARLLPVPPAALVAGARLLGKAHVAQRLCGSLQVDISRTCALLDWEPPVRVDEALARTARAFREHESR